MRSIAGDEERQRATMANGEGEEQRSEKVMKAMEEDL